MEIVLAMALIGVSTLLWLLLHIRRRLADQSNLPPKPGPTWPIFGHAMLLQRILTGDALLIQRLKQRHGPVWRLEVGRVRYVWGAEAGAAHEALVQTGALMASRPRLSPAVDLFTASYTTISSCPYGATWRALRRNLAHGLLSPASVRAFREPRARLLDRLVRRLESDRHATVGVLPACKKLMLELMLLMCFGADFDYDRHAAVREVEGVIERILAEYVTVEALADFYPLLKPLSWRKAPLRRRIHAAQMEAFSALMRHRSEARANGELTPGSYIDSLEGQLGLPLSKESMAALCVELRVGGTDTTATCVEWAMAELVNHPHVQGNLHTEIQSAVGPARGPLQEEDLDRMPYFGRRGEGDPSTAPARP